MPGIGGVVPLGGFLANLWLWEEKRLRGEVKRHYLVVLIDAVRRERGKLEEIGIKGWATGKGYVQSWGEWLADASGGEKEGKDALDRGRDTQEGWRA